MIWELHIESNHCEISSVRCACENICGGIQWKTIKLACREYLLTIGYKNSEHSFWAKYLFIFFLIKSETVQEKENLLNGRFNEAVTITHSILDSSINKKNKKKLKIF